jgi:hypothetical protein
LPWSDAGGGNRSSTGELHMILDLFLFVGLATTFFVLGIITARR